MPESRTKRPGDVVDGYRLNRLVGAGSRAAVWLAERDGALIPSEAERVELASPHRVALKIFADEVPAASVDREVDALIRVKSEHVVRLHDLSQLVGEPSIVVLECLERGSLSDLLLGRETFRAGECVTLLSSVVRAIDALHRAGIAHAQFGARSVRFDVAGRPVVVGLGHCVNVLDAGGDGPFIEDFAAFSALFTQVLSLVDDDGRESELVQLARWAAEANPQELGDEFAAGVEERLFAFAQPVPLQLAERAVPGTTTDRIRSHERMTGRDHPNDGKPSRVVYDAPSPVPGREWERAGPQPQPASLVTRASDWVAGFVDRSPVDVARKWLGRFGREHRKPLIVAGGSAAALLAVTLALVPPDASPSPAVVESTAAAGRADSADRDEAKTVTAQSQADDPILAVTDLLKKRQGCITSASRSCLATVDQVDSPLLAADLALVATTVATDPRDIPDVSAHTVSLLDRSGNFVLVALAPPASPTLAQKKPASALAIKGEAGWRLREIYEN